MCRFEYRRVDGEVWRGASVETDVVNSTTVTVSPCLFVGTVHFQTRFVVFVDAFDDLLFEDVTGPSGVPWDFAMRNHVLGRDRFMSDDASDIGDDEVFDERHVFNVHKRVYFLLVNKELFLHVDGECDLGEFFENRRQLHCRRV